MARENPPDTPEREKECLTAAEIARTATRLFAEKGFDATPVRAIAEAAGITCPTLYYHFGNKEGLAQALLIRPLNRLGETLRSLAAEPLDPIERLVRTAEAHLAFSREDPDRARFLYAVMFGPLGRELSDEVARIIRGFQGVWTEIARGLTDAGILPAEAVPDLVLALRGQIVIRTIDFLYRGGELGPDVARTVVGRVLMGTAEPSARDAIRTTLDRLHAQCRGLHFSELGPPSGETPCSAEN